MYNPNPLDKKFLCKHCGKAFRTRQGLSGHIQWKHGAKQGSTQIDATYVISKATDIQMFGKSWGLSQPDIQARQKFLTSWLEVQALCDFLNIRLNAQDFKHYLIARFAQLHGKGT